VSPLLIQFAVSTVMAVLCVVIHGIGLFSLARALRTETAMERLRRIAPLSPRGVAFTLGIVVSILALHGIEIWAFAFVYLGIGAIGGWKMLSIFRPLAIRPSVTTTPTLRRNGDCWGRSNRSWVWS
jgi:hypothetical protein